MRMSSDKGLLLSCHSEHSEESPINHLLENKPWSVSDADKFTTLNMPFVVSANLSQTHQTYFTVDMLCKSFPFNIYFTYLKVNCQNSYFTLLPLK